MTTLEKIKFIAAKTEDDSLLGASVRRILQEDRALEAMEEYDSNQLSINDDWLVSQYNRNRDINDQVNSVDQINKGQ
jgi:hypothetical protein